MFAAPNTWALLVQRFCAHLQASLGGVLHLYTICIEENALLSESFGTLDA